MRNKLMQRIMHCEEVLEFLQCQVAAAAIGCPEEYLWSYGLIFVFLWRHVEKCSTGDENHR